MSKTIPILLANHQAGQVTTLGFLMLIGPLPVSGDYVRITSMSRDFRYDIGDGNGPQWYFCSTGVEISSLESGPELSVANGEAKSLIEQFPSQGITEAMIDNGSLDGVEYKVVKVNRRGSGVNEHEWMADGPIGEVKLDRKGMILMELRSWSDLLRQNSVVQRDSMTCRVRHFGSQEGEEIFPCMKDITGMWLGPITVTALGAETIRQFSATALTQTTGFFQPGLVSWVTGNNSGVSKEVDTHVKDLTLGGVFDLKFLLRHAIQVGDTFMIRPDCNRHWGRIEIGDPIEVNSCLYHTNHEWFRGEPFIPVSDFIGLTVPGAAAGGMGVS